MLRVIAFVQSFAFAVAALAGAVSACVAPAPQAASISIACEGGIGFRIRMTEETALVGAGASNYVLKRRPTSFSRKYASESVAFILDGRGVVLIGAEGGPYRDCRTG